VALAFIPLYSQITPLFKTKQNNKITTTNKKANWLRPALIKVIPWWGTQAEKGGYAPVKWGEVLKFKGKRGLVSLIKKKWFFSCLSHH